MATTFNSRQSEATAYVHAPRLLNALSVRFLLAALALSAGAIHLAMAPIHAGESTTEAIGFAVAGWAQVLLGLGLLIRPTGLVLGATLVVNLAIIVGYILSRTTGLPFSAQPWHAEDVAAVDVMATVFEGILVVGAGALLLRPDFAARLIENVDFSAGSVVMAAALPAIVFVTTSVALADPDIAEHGHGGGDALASNSGGDHGHGAAALAADTTLTSLAEDRCDLAFNPAAYWREATMAGADTLMGGEAASVDHNASAYVAGSAELDKLIGQQMTSEGEAGDAAMVVALSNISDDVYDNWLRWLASSGLMGHAHGGNEFSLAPDDNKGMGGHLGPQPWHAMTDQAQCDKLEEELALARDTALTYPTVKDAKAAGWMQVTPYVPGIAAHFMKFSIVDGKFDITQPEMILYDGTDDDSRVIGLSYYVRHQGSAEPTQGFTGNNDHFHRHDALCVGAGGVVGDSTTTPEECAARGGRKADGSSGWMNHVWVVPGCESPWGVFSGANPILDPGLGAKSATDGGGCAGSGVLARYDLTAGNASNTPTAVGGEVELATAPQ
jgi:hypothetical protein